VDKDLAAAILAQEVGAQVLLILTDVSKVQRGFGSLMPEEIERMTVGEATELIDAGEFEAGSMGPKVQAAVNFLHAGGARAIIADLDDALPALEGKEGTWIVPR
jgi:carbamate kinase